MNNMFLPQTDIVHESIHAANGIFSYIGAEADVNNDEPFVYLVSWIVKCCERTKECQE